MGVPEILCACSGFDVSAGVECLNFRNRLRFGRMGLLHGSRLGLALLVANVRCPAVAPVLAFASLRCLGPVGLPLVVRGVSQFLFHMRTEVGRALVCVAGR